MYEGVHTYPDGDSTVGRYAATAANQGFDGIVVRNHGDTPPPTFDADRIRTRYHIDVVTGIEIRADDPPQASGYLGSHRDTNTIVLLHGGTTALNRFAARQPRVDILAHPLLGNGTIDHVIARTAAENNVRIECNFAPILRSQGGARVRAVQKLRSLLSLIEHYDVPIVVSADPTSHLHLRNPRELFALGTTIGMSKDRVRAGLEEWATLTAQNRTRRTGSYIRPGVSRYPSTENHDHTP